MKKWIIKEPDVKVAADLKRQCDLSLLAVKLLTSRGCNNMQKLSELFEQGGLEDPFAILDMQEAVDTINSFIDSYELICVYGDYDCDGITATALLYGYLLSMGANVTYYINEREEGYGMNIGAVRKLAERGVALIVTVDNGISCVEEAEEIYRLGMKLVVTDHHQPPEVLPRAEAVVDPHRHDCTSSFKDLAGVGVALKLCAALDGGDHDAVVEQYSDLCAIGTVGDLVPLRGENRYLVNRGLLYLANTENHALNELIDKAGADRTKLNSGTLAYQLCPRINAAGRFASPLIALEALLSEDPDEAAELVGRMIELNDRRKQTEAQIFDEIKQLIDSDPSVLDKRVMVLAGRNWHHGVIGIVSAKVMETYGKPNIIISIEDDGNARGSARSLKGFNIHTCLTYASEFLDKYGGHECAGGLSLKEENIPAFTEKVLEYAAQQEQMPPPLAECDMAVSTADLDIEAIRSLDMLEPFGTDNPRPLFCLSGCRVNAIYPLSGGKHTKLDVTLDGKKVQVLVFSKAPKEMFFAPGSMIDVAAHIDINEWNGRESLSIKAVDIRPHGMDTDRYFAAKDAYEKFRGGIKLGQNFLRRMQPQRAELVAVYKLLSSLGETGLDELYMRINSPAINYCKLRLMIDIFRETGLISYEASSQQIKVLPVTKKADLGEAPTMKLIEEKLKESSK